MYKKKKHFTFQHYWGAFCQGAFVLFPYNFYVIYFTVKKQNYKFFKTRTTESLLSHTQNKIKLQLRNKQGISFIICL